MEKEPSPISNSNSQTYQRRKNESFIIFIFTTLLFYQCSYHSLDESYYFLYYGDRTIVSSDLVLLGSNNSFVDSLMPIGLPIKIILKNDDFKVLKSNLSKVDLFNPSVGNSTGILVIHYLSNKQSEKYLFRLGKESDNLINIIKKSINSQTESDQILGWLNGLVSLHKNESIQMSI